MKIFLKRTVMYRTPVKEGGKTITEKVRFGGREVEALATEGVTLWANTSAEVDEKLGKELIKKDLAVPFDPMLHGGKKADKVGSDEDV